VPPSARRVDHESATPVLGALALVVAGIVALLAGLSSGPGGELARVAPRIGTFERARLVETCRKLGADARTLDELARGGPLLDVALVAEVAAAERVVGITELPTAPTVTWRAADVERVDVTEALAERLARGEGR